MTIFELPKIDHDRLAATFAASDVYASRYEAPIGDELREAEKVWRTTTSARLVVAGLGKVGKSSFYQALLQSGPLIPVDLEISTATAFHIQYGTPQRYVVHFLPGPDSETPPEPVTIPIGGERAGYEVMLDYGSNKGNPNNSKRIDRIDVILKHDLLKDGVILVDTPGIDSFSWEHTIVSWRAYPLCDAIVFAIDGSRSVLSRPEAEAIERMQGWRKPIIFLQTKTDEPSAEATAELERENRQAIGTLLGIPPERVPYYRISSRLKELHVRSGREDHLELSGFRPIIEGIGLEFMPSVRATRAVPLIVGLGNWVAKEAEAVGELIRINEETSTADLEAAKVAKNRHAAMRQAFIKEKLQDEIRTFEASCRKALRNALTDLRHELDTHPDGDIAGGIKRRLRDDRASAREIADNIDDYQSEVLRIAERRVQSIERDYEAAILKANWEAFSAIGAQAKAEAEELTVALERVGARMPSSNFSQINRGTLTDLISFQQGLSAGGLAATMTGGGAAIVASAIAFPPLGALVAIGTVLACVLGGIGARRSQLREQALSELGQRLSYIIGEVARTAPGAFQNHLEDFLPAARKRILDAANEPLATLGKEVAAIDARIVATREECERNRRLLAERQAELRNVGESLRGSYRSSSKKSAAA